MEVEQTETVEVVETEAPEVRDQAQINEWMDDKIGPVETEEIEEIEEVEESQESQESQPAEEPEPETDENSLLARGEE